MKINHNSFKTFKTFRENIEKVALKHSISIEKSEDVALKQTKSIENIEEVALKHSKSVEIIEKAVVKHSKSIQNIEEIASKHSKSIENIEEVALKHSKSIESIEEAVLKLSKSMENIETFQIKQAKEIFREITEIKRKLDVLGGKNVTEPQENNDELKQNQIYIFYCLSALAIIVIINGMISLYKICHCLVKHQRKPKKFTVVSNDCYELAPAQKEMRKLTDKTCEAHYESVNAYANSPQHVQEENLYEEVMIKCSSGEIQ